jgi:U4/U6.U5 tri-snRNP-associated protein 2
MTTMEGNKYSNDNDGNISKNNEQYTDDIQSNNSNVQHDEASVVSCPYLDTIERSVLDFDLEATCCITLESGPHIYACLVCGKYFRGRGKQTPAYIHAVNESHYVFCHLLYGTFHSLPDGYEIHDTSLNDIRAALHPTYREHDIEQIDTNSELSRDIFGRLYLPGFVGLNNPNKTDCINAVVQALAHVKPIRDYFLRQPNISPITNITQQQGTIIGGVSPLQANHITQCFGDLIRKIWSHQRFKGHVDPHKLINAIAAASKNKFKIGHEQIEVGNFMAWFLHQLHLGTGGTITTNNHRKKKKRKTDIAPINVSIIEQVFQGKVRVTTRQAKRKKQKDPSTEIIDDRAGSDAEDFDDDNYADKEKAPSREDNGKDDDDQEICVEETEMDTNFLQLTLDISEKPLFRDEDGGLVIPQEPLITVLQKFDGVTFSDAIQRGVVQRRKYNIQELPPYLILHFARFTSNEYSRVKNPTIVAFPVKNLDLSKYVEKVRNQAPLPSEDEIRSMNVSLAVHNSMSTVIKVKS